MNLDTGTNTMTWFHAELMASRKVDTVSKEDLLKPRVQEIIDIINEKPKYDDHDLETKPALYHQSIGYFKQLKPRNQLTDDEVRMYPHLKEFLEDPGAHNANRIYQTMKCFWRAFAWNLLHNPENYESVEKLNVMGFFKPKEGWKAKGYKTFGAVTKLLDIVYSETSQMVDFIIEVKQDGIDEMTGLVKWTYSIVFIKGEGDTNIPIMYTTNGIPELTVHKSFKERIGELRDYKVKYGDCRVPARFESNPSLGKWCANLKQS